MKSIAFGIAVLINCGIWAAPPPDFYLEHDWYVAELLLFEYPATNLGRTREAESLLGSLPKELHSDVSVVELASVLASAGSRGLSSDSVIFTESPHPWFFNPETVELVPTLRGYFKLGSHRGEQVLDTVEEPLTVASIYPGWLQPEWFSPLESWSRFLESVHLPQSEVTEISERLFGTPATLDELEEELELTIGQRVEEGFRNFEADLLSQRGQWLESEFMLGAAADRIRRSSWDLIHHGKFHFILESGVDGQKFFLQLGTEQDHGFLEYEVLLDISKRLYIHTKVHIWKVLSQRERNYLQDEMGASLSAIPVYSLEERRRFADTDPNYFDHPIFGLILKIDRLPIPTELLELLEASDDVEEPGT